MRSDYIPQSRGRVDNTQCGVANTAVTPLTRTLVERPKQGVDGAEKRPPARLLKTCSELHPTHTLSNTHVMFPYHGGRRAVSASSHVPIPAAFALKPASVVLRNRQE